MRQQYEKCDTELAITNVNIYGRCDTDIQGDVDIISHFTITQMTQCHICAPIEVIVYITQV